MKRRYKLLVIIFISFLLVIFIYFIKPKNDFLYLAIGSNLNYNESTYDYAAYINMNIKKNHHYKYVTTDNLAIKNIIDIIKNNKKGVADYIRKANLITMCLGSYELNNHKYLDEGIKNEYLDNMSELLVLLRKITDAKIFLIDPYKGRINKQLEYIAYKNNTNYISITKDNNYYIIRNETYLNNKGAKNLANRIIK